MKPHGAKLETCIMLMGTALFITTAIVRPSDHHFHLSGGLLLMTGTYATIARKLPDQWMYGVASVFLAVVTVGYSIYAFATRCPGTLKYGIRKFFLIFFIEAMVTICIAFVAVRQVRQLFVHNFNVKCCLPRRYKNHQTEVQSVDSTDYELYNVESETKTTDAENIPASDECSLKTTACQTNDCDTNA